MTNVLPLKKFTLKQSLELIRWIQEKNHRSYLSHRKRKIREANRSYIT
jgi:hypothetical protein